MIFRPDINLGTIIQIAVFLIALMGAIRKVGIVEQKLNVMYSWFEHTVLNHTENFEVHERVLRDKKFFTSGSDKES